MQVQFIKWIAAFVLLTLTFFFTMLPLLILSKIQRTHGQTNRSIYMRIISLLSCFGGGVFLGTCLLHLFPDVDQQMTKVFEMMHLNPSYPIAEFLLAFGFLIVLVTEQIVLNCQQYSEEEIPFLNHQHSHGAHVGNRSNIGYSTIIENTEGSEHERSFHEDHSSHSTLRSVLLVLALSLHSVFEGLAIGLQDTSENVIRILAAVLIHKSIIAFTLGLNLTHSKLKKSVIIRCNAIFSIMSPLGTVAGSLISDIGTGLCMALISGVLQGLAAGTFVYVTFFEVLPHELNSREDKLCKVTFLILGFSAVALLIAFVPD